MKKITASIPESLSQQIQQAIDRDGMASTSSFTAELIRRGLASYCEERAKIQKYLNTPP